MAYVVGNKTDLGEVSGAGFNVSAMTGDGIDRLLAGIYERLPSKDTEVGLLGHLRMVESAKEALGTLDDVTANLHDDPAEVISQKIGIATNHLNALIGTVGTDDVLDAVFGNFCLGK